MEFQGPCVKYDADKQILIATPFRDWSERPEWDDTDWDDVGGTCWNHADRIILWSGLIISVILGLFSLLLCCFCCKEGCKKLVK